MSVEVYSEKSEPNPSCSTDRDKNVGVLLPCPTDLDRHFDMLIFSPLRNHDKCGKCSHLRVKWLHRVSHYNPAGIVLKTFHYSSSTLMLICIRRVFSLLVRMRQLCPYSSFSLSWILLDFSSASLLSFLSPV